MSQAVIPVRRKSGERLLRFVDDVEFYIDADARLIHEFVHNQVIGRRFTQPLVASVPAKCVAGAAGSRMNSGTTMPAACWVVAGPWM